MACAEIPLGLRGSVGKSSGGTANTLAQAGNRLPRGVDGAAVQSDLQPTLIAVTMGVVTR